MLSTKQQRLIEELRKNSRTRLTELSEALKTPLSTVHDRLYKLVQTKKIRLVTIPKFSSLDMPIQTWVFLLTKNRKQARKFLEKHLHINTLFSVHNGADFACECVFANFKQYDDFIHECRTYGEVTHHPILEVVCQETARVHS